MIAQTNVSLPKTWKKYRYHPVQAALWEYSQSKGRFAAIVAGRRSGKTDECRRICVAQLPIIKPWTNPLYFYVLPTFQQAKKVAWYPILDLIPKNWIPKNGINRSELSITTIFGSKLYITGADKPERLEGVPADWVFIDESSDQRPGLYARTIVPMLAERDGKCYRLGVPKRNGIGRVEFRDFFNRGQQRLDGIASFHWKSADILTPEQIAEAKSQLDDTDFAEQFEASWQDIGSSVYYNFRNFNIRDDVNYKPEHEIVVGCDFNVNPMCWSLSHFVDGKLYTFDEIFLRDTNTPSALDFLYSKYRGHTAGWKFIGDATSKSRKTSSVRSDYLIIKNDSRFDTKKVLFPLKNPAVRDRYAAVNRAFKTADGTVRAYINVTCKRLINDLNTVSYQEGTTEIEDYDGTDIGHMSDAYGYKVYRLMPIKLESESVPHVLSSVG